jgi:vacuolar-type H+-ATPase subunit H
VTLQARTQALLDLVEDDRRTQCAAIVADARAQAETLLAQARADARARVAQFFAEQRARAAAVLAAAQADLQTRRRLHAQHHVEALLARGWARLPEVLRARWSDPAARAAWVAHGLAHARGRLPAAAWTVRHGAGWPEAEREVVAVALARELGTPPHFVHDVRIEAGLRIGAGGNVVDATLIGLLADRDEIGGRLIGLLEASG